jgi:hypothetical protein
VSKTTGGRSSPKPRAAFVAQAINALRYKFGFGNECGYIRRYSLRGLGPNKLEDEYDLGSIGAGDGKDTHLEAD